MEPPHPYWADHDHSDEHLNLLFTTHRRQAIEPSPPHRADSHDHDNSDEHLNLTYATVRQQRPSYPLSPSLSSFSPLDSGNFSPSLSRRRARAIGKRRLGVVNTTPPPPPPPTPEVTPLVFAEDQQAQEEWERELSSGWSASSEASTVEVGGSKRAVKKRSPLMLLGIGAVLTSAPAA